MNLDLLPSRNAGAAENMATDFLLLHRYPQAAAPRFRHYGWRAPAFTFGYAQKIAFVRSQLPAGETFDLCRRPTGGGLVDHRADWTYALVIPRGHPLEELRATHSYRLVHEALAGALGEQRIEAALKPCDLEQRDCRRLPSPPNHAPANKPVSPEGVCFQRAEIFDVVHARSGAKIAGAAQKRNKHGLLFQGSIWKPAVDGAVSGTAIDWERFETDFVARLAAALAVEPAPTAWPDFNEEELSGLTEQYSSPEWVEFR